MLPENSPAFSHQTAQESVVDYLRGLILSGELLPGERLVQAELAEHLGISRTPIREALHKLASEGLVTFSSYKGASVATFSLEELEEVYAVRTALESHAASLAAQRITEQELEQLESLLQQMAQAFQENAPRRLLEIHHQFHVGICAAAKQPRLHQLAVQHLELTNVYQQMALSLGRGAQDPVIEHQEILTTLRQRDAERAGKLIHAHLQATATELLALFQDQAGEEDA